MESTECIAAHSTARTILLHSSCCAALVAVRTADSTSAGVSRSCAVVVMGLLNQPPPTVSRRLIPLCTRHSGLSEVVRRGLDTLAGARYSTTGTTPYSTTGTRAV